MNSIPASLMAGLLIARVEGCPERVATLTLQNGDESKGSTMYSVYIVRCSDGTLYIGHTENPQARAKAHNDDRGASYTFKRRPVRLVYSEGFLSEADAIERERQLKGWSRTKKEALIAGDLDGLKRLSKR